MIKNSLRWMFLIIGTTIGAGYASGREIWQFFGHESGLAILLFALCFIVSCFVIMDVSFSRKSKDYKSVLHDIIGGRLACFYDYMILIYLFTTTVVMIAGSGALGQVFKFSKWWGVIFIALTLIAVFIKGINQLLSINQWLIPLLIISLTVVLIFFIQEQDGANLLNFHHSQSNWLAAFPFTALNILPLIAVLGAIGHQVKSKGEIWFASVGSGLLLGGLSYIYNYSLILVEERSFAYEIPLFAILEVYPVTYTGYMLTILWIAIFTTAAANMLGMVSRLKRVIDTPEWLLIGVLLLLMLPLTAIGFSTLIAYLYPIYGILNLYILTKLLIFPFISKKTS